MRRELRFSSNRDLVVFDAEFVNDPCYEVLFEAATGTGPPLADMGLVPGRRGFAGKRIVAICWLQVSWSKKAASPSISMHRWPAFEATPLGRREHLGLEQFLSMFRCKRSVRPRLVGFNSKGHDLQLIVERCVVNGVRLGPFGEPAARIGDFVVGPDYLHAWDSCHVDLLWDFYHRLRMPLEPLHRWSLLTGGPGITELHQRSVQQLWDNGEFDRITERCMCDVCTTWLLALRVMHTTGVISTKRYRTLVERLYNFLVEEQSDPTNSFLAQYIRAWDRAQNIARIAGRPAVQISPSLFLTE